EDKINPLAPTATNRAPFVETDNNCAEVPDVRVVQAFPFGEVKIVPVAPTAAYEAPPHAIPNRELVEEETRVHAVPSGEVKLSPPAPTPTNCVAVHAAPRNACVAPETLSVQVTVSAEVRMSPGLPAATHRPPPSSNPDSD